ncbi:molybdopterin molybdenumtransferase MoeA [Actinoplanes sp. LDG1-06]|uniref:Molybdopterin molybdenumtransferase n=1 Tax=Paractinoplanes ovalisporus TaxID=2810368 RepID=A0ABS2A3L7_9ACTN|nr:molybdopterin-binding protein [Actinoplanes ovalisporus]MBM2614442.1 molybdopterin molybdenumtransferase MoeA [Actinoplanes ovalisporus]
MTQQRRHVTGLAWADARAAARDLPAALPPETTTPQAACGCVLAEPIHAAASVPGFDNAAMDGYAVAGLGPWTIVGLLLAGHSQCHDPDNELRPGGDASDGERLREGASVGERLRAGRAFVDEELLESDALVDERWPGCDVLGPGTAVEIATGARVPAEADAVLPYEDCHVEGGIVHGARGPRNHIRRAGDDLRPGDLIVPAGRTVTATVAAAATQAGVESVLVRRRPTVALLVTGDEVVLTGRPGPGQVRDSFSGIVAAVTGRAGGVLHFVRHVGDNPDHLAAALGAPDLEPASLDVAAGDGLTGDARRENRPMCDLGVGGSADVVVVSGSSSAGAADHLHALLDELGAEWLVRGVACRPGHPQALAQLPDGRWVVSLPGNPYAGLVSALTLLEPLLEALAGRAPAPLPRVAVTGEAKLVPGGVRIVPVRWRREGAVAEVLPAKGSAGLAAAAAADALAVLPDDWTEGGEAVLLALP